MNSTLVYTKDKGIADLSVYPARRWMSEVITGFKYAKEA